MNASAPPVRAAREFSTWVRMLRISESKWPSVVVSSSFGSSDGTWEKVVIEGGLECEEGEVPCGESAWKAVNGAGEGERGLGGEVGEEGVDLSFQSCGALMALRLVLVRETSMCGSRGSCADFSPGREAGLGWRFFLTGLKSIM